MVEKSNKELEQNDEVNPRYMKYFDANYQRAYYFDKKTEQSIWVLPEGTDETKEVLDCVVVEEEVKEEVVEEEQKQELEVEKYQAYKSSVDQMQKEALEMLYPDALVNLTAAAETEGPLSSTH